MIHWAYRGTAKGEEWFGYLWGEAHGVICHTRGRSRPCLTALTGGELECDQCKAEVATQWIGYVPIVRESDGRPVFVIVHETAAELLAALKWRTRVLVSRGSAADDGTAVVRAPAQKQWQTSLPGLQQPADLTRTLLTVWKTPALTAWYNATHGASDKGLSLPVPAEVPAVPDQSETPAEAEINRQLREVMRRHPQRQHSLPGAAGEHLNGKPHTG